MRLVNADRIDRNMAKLYDYKDLHWANVWEIPTEIDLVKCEECRFYTGKNHLAVNNSSYGFCEKINRYVDTNFYCAFAERKEDETND